MFVHSPHAERPARLTRVAPGFTSRANIAADLMLVVGAVYLAHGIQHGFQTGDVGSLAWTAAALVSTWVVTSAALRQYAAQNYQRSLLDETAMVTTLVVALVTVETILHLAAPPGTPLPRLPLLVALLWPPVMLLRLLVFRQIADREEPVEDVLIVGIGPIARLTAQDMRNHGRLRVVGHLRFPDESDKELALLERSYQAEGAELQLLGTSCDLEQVLRKVVADEVYMAGNARKSGDEMQEAIRACERFGIPFALPAYVFRLERAQAVDAKPISDGFLHYHNTKSQPHQMAIKRLFDIVSSGIALWILLPMLFAVAVIIKLSSRGPVFFKQLRVGLHGRPFHMLKFRSMVTNAEELKATLMAQNEQSGPVFKMKHDPRITRIGRFIRKYSIDELPQLINVLRGDMSIVGPRPPVPDEVSKYEAWQRRRLSVRPGLTCIWQVSGRNQITFEDWMYLDMQYIDHWSLTRDFSLIFRTVPIVITGRGAS